MKKIFLLLISVLTISCSKDGPKFDLLSSEINLMGSDSSSEIKMKREEPDSGPLFNIKISNPQEIQKLSKRLVCGPLTIEGRSGSGTEFLSFKISQIEFPGLLTLPSKASCKLVVKLDGKYNGSREKEFPVKFLFNSNPPMQISRFIARQVGFVPTNPESEVLLERYIVKNTFNYSAGFTYFASYSCSTFGVYGQGATRGCGMQSPFNIGITKIKLRGFFENMTGDFTSWVSFSLPPGEEVVIESYGRISDLQSRFFNASTDPFSPLNGTPLLGVHLRQCSDPVGSQGLSMWGDFRLSKDDFSQPGKFVTGSDAIQNLPEWNPKGCN